MHTRLNPAVTTKWNVLADTILWNVVTNTLGVPVSPQHSEFLTSGDREQSWVSSHTELEPTAQELGAEH